MSKHTYVSLKTEKVIYRIYLKLILFTSNSKGKLLFRQKIQNENYLASPAKILIPIFYSLIAYCRLACRYFPFYFIMIVDPSKHGKNASHARTFAIVLKYYTQAWLKYFVLKELSSFYAPLNWLFWFWVVWSFFFSHYGLILNASWLIINVLAIKKDSALQTNRSFLY